MPGIIESDDFESPALFWLYREIKRLNETLMAAGISDEGNRREICEEFLFDTQAGSPLRSLREATVSSHHC